MDPLAQFREIWFSDFEFCSQSGERPVPHCCTAYELRSGRTVRQWLGHPRGSAGACPPLYSTGRDSLLVTYYGPAEAGCHLARRWPLPENHVDLYAEFSLLTCGRPLIAGRGLLGALSYFDIGSGHRSARAVRKDEMRALAQRGGPYTLAEQSDLLSYNQDDVEDTVALFKAMARHIDWPRALIRGRYVNTVAQMEHEGVPIDVPTLRLLQANWDTIKSKLVERVDRNFGVYEGTSFRERKFERWLSNAGIDWPRLPSGAPALKRDDFSEMTKFYPAVGPLKELRTTLDQLRSLDLPVGADGRARTMLSPFASRTSRNQPRTSEFIFGFPKWARGLIQPRPGRALAALDYEQEEFAIAAACSGDLRMQAAYASGDPYLASAKAARVVPEDATRESHPAERNLFKTLTIASQYSMGAETLASRLACSIARAKELLGVHRRTFARYWQWSDGAQDHAMLHGELTSAFGWRVQIEEDANPCFVRNFLLQANGAEILRLACIFAAEAGVTICAPVHDALVIEAADDEIEDAVRRCEVAMVRASVFVLNGFPLRVESKIIRHPQRYPGAEQSLVWRELQALLPTMTA